MATETIGRRVRDSIAAKTPAVPQYQVAEAVSMTADALSRAVNEQRSFSSIELARLAEYLGVEVHWLITGEPDPQQLVFAARHEYDQLTGHRAVPGADQDRATLESIALAYRQAGDLGATPDLPRTSVEIRAALGPDFVRPFAQRIEDRLGVHVVRVRELTTAYCFRAGARQVIALNATGNWFHENFSLAHELGHLALRHTVTGRPGSEEAAANAFAASLLLPEGEVRDAGFDSMTSSDLAAWVWTHGISIQTLRHRLTTLRIQPSPAVEDAATGSTQRLLRRHLRTDDPFADEVSERMTDAAGRRFPQALRSAHLDRVESGTIGPETLAWMLDLPVGALEVEVPDPPTGDLSALATSLGLALT
jgi:Zn-dependent peptidase ImmA (M78 family)/transcriptional regulator with XRE-family HTH domain